MFDFIIDHSKKQEEVQNEKKADENHGATAAYVMPAYTGEIEENDMKEGMLVEEGDVLFTIKSTDYNLQEEQLLASRDIYEQQIAKSNLLVKSIQNNTNYFDSTNLTV